jgi:hypothetical protein
MGLFGSHNRRAVIADEALRGRQSPMPVPECHEVHHRRSQPWADMNCIHLMRCETEETRRTTGDGFELAALVGGTYRLSGDYEDGHRFCS